MEKKDYKLLSDEEKIKLLETEQDKIKRLQIIRSLSNDELMLKYTEYLTDEEKAAVSYSLSDLENKVKLIESITDEKWITAATAELPSNEYKIKLLSKIKTPYYKIRIIQTLDDNEEEIINTLNVLENEKDRATIIARLTNNELKQQYLQTLQDDNNKSIVVMSLDNEEVKQEYISKVKNKGIRTLLIASLKDREKRSELLQIEKKHYSNINIPDGITVGMEIESEGENSFDAYVIDNLMHGWNAKADTSLSEGVEITSPILTNAKEDVQDIYCVCKIMQDLGQEVSERCGGHIHVGADYLKTKEAFANLIELWSNNEEILYLISNQKGDMVRKGAFEFASPISKRIKDAIDADKFIDFQSLTKEGFIDIIKGVQEEGKEKKGRGTGINFLNVNARHINTIEFRLANGTIDANTWIENATLFGGMVAVSQKLSDIQNKNTAERRESDRQMLERFALLKKHNLSKEDRLDLFLSLCVPEELKDVYVHRYQENSRLIENTKVRDQLKQKISNKPVVFPIGTQLETTLKNIAFAERARDVRMVTGETREGIIEQETPTQTIENNMTLED